MRLQLLSFDFLCIIFLPSPIISPAFDNTSAKGLLTLYYCIQYVDVSLKRVFDYATCTHDSQVASNVQTRTPAAHQRRCSKLYGSCRRSRCDATLSFEPDATRISCAQPQQLWPTLKGTCWLSLMNWSSIAAEPPPLAIGTAFPRRIVLFFKVALRLSGWGTEISLKCQLTVVES